jgi:transglutaminase-like putative cysteine protease
MKNAGLILITGICFLITSCRPKTDFTPYITAISNEIEQGNLRSAVEKADSLKELCKKDKYILRKADSLARIAERIAIDFSVTEEQIDDEIVKKAGPFSQLEKAVWENRGWLEFRLINDKKMYFNRAASNLRLIRDFNDDRKKHFSDISSDPVMKERLEHTENVVKASDNQNKPVLPVKMKITYTLSVHPDVIPEGETIRCWLPYPKVGNVRQSDVKLLRTSERIYLISPESSTHGTIYLESRAKKGMPSLFITEFVYQSYAQYFNYDSLKPKPYNKEAGIYRKYTAEQPPQIHFTPAVKQLADSVAGNETDPKEIVRKIYFWFKNNITWTGALEYSIMTDIPQYVIDNGRGDCGMQTLLFISMLRYKGIPVRWQSGWMVPPGNENLHDWCEVYYEGTGWVPTDVSYDLQLSENRYVSGFYLSGIDSYRMIVNNGIGGMLYPPKKYIRSEPYDFQRGEVEWSGGNLYFDKWDYDMKIEYLK